HRVSTFPFIAAPPVERPRGEPRSPRLAEASRQTEPPGPLRGAGPGSERLHHALHLRELLDEAIDLLARRSGPPSDAPAARSIEDRVVPPLEGRHRIDDRLDADEFLAVDPCILQLPHGSHPGQ